MTVSGPSCIICTVSLCSPRRLDGVGGWVFTRCIEHIFEQMVSAGLLEDCHEGGASAWSGVFWPR